jgi:hypothetical protein
MRKEHPILFSPPMVQAILAGRKTQTRRAVKFPLKCPTHKISIGQGDNPPPVEWARWQPGDILWVRESFTIIGSDPIRGGEGEIIEDRKIYAFKGQKQPHIEKLFKWKPSIHLPKAAARIWLEVINVRIERLHDISPGDACDEGINYWNVDRDAFEGGELMADFENYMWRDDENYADYHSPTYASCVESFFSLWQSINGIESFKANPWVWVIEFNVLSTTGKPLFKKLADVQGV